MLLLLPTEQLRDCLLPFAIQGLHIVVCAPLWHSMLWLLIYAVALCISQHFQCTSRAAGPCSCLHICMYRHVTCCACDILGACGEKGASDYSIGGEATERNEARPGFAGAYAQQIHHHCMLKALHELIETFHGRMCGGCCAARTLNGCCLYAPPRQSKPFASSSHASHHPSCFFFFFSETPRGVLDTTCPAAVT